MTMTDVVLFHRSSLKLYDSLLKEICDSCDLSGLELTIISFLHNNPEYDTAKDISVFRMIPKGNVSQGVNSLMEKGLLLRSPDANDRRKIHLSLTERSIPLVEKVENAKLIAAKAADQLIDIRGIEASFALGRDGDVVSVSGRSLGRINVQIICERLGGGGHLTMAGAQLHGVDMEEARAMVKMRVEEYLQEVSPT